IAPAASTYFRIFALGLPIMVLNYVSAGMLQCSGDMKVPSLLNVCMCFLNVLFNALLIFPSGTFRLPFLGLPLPGAGLSVAGAALGTVLARLVVTVLLLYFLLLRSEILHLRRGERAPVSRQELIAAARISVPQGFESAITGSAYVAFTAIVAPLGTAAIAANSFAITAESLCYMPGYGIGTAATTLIGQSYGANRRDMTKNLSWLLTVLTMVVMTGSGVLMYVFAPWMIGLLSPDASVRSLGTQVLRIEAFAEPLYGASIAINGVFRGMGDTLTSSVLNLISMWAVRIPLAAFLSKSYGLPGVWRAMCIELCVRGLLFIFRLWRKKL
ncbi:MAG: MATE family efflux transporter, partial [Blautia sp.]|nr:MATE family efflux transporter [Blautia sp.]